MRKFLFFTVLFVFAATTAFAQAPNQGEIVINEVDYDDASGDDLSFIELFNTTATTFDLSTIEVVGQNGTTIPNEYGAVTLSGTMAGGTYFLLGTTTDSGGLAVATDATFGSSLQNGAPDGVFIRRISDGVIIDSVSYEGDGSHPAASPDSGDAGTDTADATSLSRVPDGADTGDNAVDFQVVAPTPQGQPGPSTASITSAYIDTNGDIVVGFDSDPGAVVAGDFTLTIDGSGAAVTGISGSGISRTLTTSATPAVNGTVDDIAVAATAGTSATNVNFYAFPTLNLVKDGTIADGTTIGVIGTVTGFQTTGGQNGYAIATATGATNGMYVFDPGNDGSVAVGDSIQIVTTVGTFSGLLQLGSVAGFANLGAVTPIAATVIAPGAFQADGSGGSEDDYTGVFIRFNAALTAGADDGFGEILFAEGVKTDDGFYDYSGDVSFPYTASALEGIGYFSFGEYKVFPLSAAGLPVELSAFQLD